MDELVHLLAEFIEGSLLQIISSDFERGLKALRKLTTEISRSVLKLLRPAGKLLTSEADRKDTERHGDERDDHDKVSIV